MKKNSLSLTKLPLVKCCILWCALITYFPSHSQQKELYYFPSIAEKIYLQLDNKVYTTAGTIWFRAVVTDAAEHIPTKISGVLYVELISPDEKLAERKLIRIGNGIGEGFFELSPDYTEGLYMIRAYTEWNKNFGTDFIFKEYIQVFAATPHSKADPVKEVTIIEEQKDQRRVKASFNPLVIDSTHTKDLKLLLSFDERKDTLSIKKNAAGSYSLDYPIPPNTQFITFQLETKNQVSYAKSIILAKDYVDLQFFPESGEMVHGLPALLGFKALDSVGKGKVINGDILNSKAEVIATFKSNALGMGTVMLPEVDSAEQYTARVTTAASGATEQKTFPLPRAVAKGHILSVVKGTDKIHLRILSNYLLNDSLAVRTSCRGLVYFDVKGRLKNGLLEFSLPVISLPEGIIAFTIMSDSVTPVAERLYFNERPESRLQIAISTDKDVYTQREQTRLSIEIKNQDEQPVNANLSVLVMNKDQLGSMHNSRENILSYLLLSSDLKGRIENPGYYFGNDPGRTEALNALLLTQGWRKYNYTKPTGKIVFQPEFSLTVSGAVSGGLFGNKQKKGTSLTMMTFGQPPSVDTQTADSLGRFSFSMNDQYQQTVNVLIQTSNKAGAKKDYTITLDKKQTPEILFDHIRTVESPDSIVKAYVSKSLDNKKKLDEYIAKTEGITLSEVIVKSYAMTPERKKVIDQYGQPKTIIEGDDIRDKEAKWSYGLYSVLLFNFPDKIRIVRARDGTLFARVNNGEPTLVVIDGIPVQAYDYGLIPGIPPSEVKSFEIIEYAKNFSRLYCEIFPDACLNAPAWGNVIAIYTYGKNGLFGANRAPGIMKAAIPVFSAPREFYAPKYEQLNPDDWLKPDLRTLIHWAPKIQTDSMGQASVSFYNGDITGNMEVWIETISEDGEIGFRRLDFNVKKREE